MADITYRANLSVPNIPVDPLTFARTVIVKGSDQNYVPNLVSKTDADKDAGIPQVYYAANVLPTEQGFRSVGFTSTVEACPGTPYFAFPVRSAANSTLLIHTREGYLYELNSALTPQFRFIGTYVGDLTYATVAGTTYINIAGLACYEYDFTSGTLVAVVLAGLDPLYIRGIVGVGGYLLAWSEDALAWSSLVDATDFIPSLDTGAGGGSVEGAKGAITYCVAATQGIFVFTEENCISGTISGNARYPFNFKEVVGSSGITDLQAVTFDGNQNVAYAFTRGGFQQISHNAAKPIWADLTDNADNSPVWDENTVVSATTGVARGITGAKLTVAGARYVCVSIQSGTTTVNGVVYPVYRDIWVYDLSLLRWGRIVREHVEVFSDENNQLAIIDSAGCVVLCENSNTAIEGYGVERHSGVLVLGKYQYTRQRMLQLQSVELDNVYPVTVRDPLTLVNLGDLDTEVYTLSQSGIWEETVRISQNKYNTRKTAQNHSIMVKGNFYLNTVLLTFNNHGGR